MKTYSVTITHTQSFFTQWEFEAPNDDEAALVADAKVKNLNNGVEDKDITDNMEQDEDNYDSDDLECITNCDEDEEDEEGDEELE